MNGIKARITRSRLMGSMGLKLCWQNGDDRIEQFYILDAEGLGISDFQMVKNPSEKESKQKEDAIMSGLGSERMDIDFQHALYLVNRYGRKTLEYGKKLPDGYEHFQFILDMDFDDSKYSHLFESICKKFESEVEFVNYMVMRFVARDREGLKHFSRNAAISDMRITNRNGALLKNEAEKVRPGKYKCTTIFEDEDVYYKALLWLAVEKEEDAYVLNSLMIQDVRQISDEDALENISKEEYVGIYKILDSDFEGKFHEENSNYIKIAFDNGNMYTLFNEDNAHVNRQTYLINEDIKDIFYFVDNQLIVSNYSPDDRIESDDRLHRYKSHIDLKDEFIFNCSVIYDFANSKMNNFYEFLMK